jgi:class 3 adenylate cyclase
MRSLTIKFSALVVTLLLVTCVTLAMIATTHERASLVAEVEKLGLAFAMNLAANAKEPLLANDDLSLESLVKKVSDENGVVIVRILDRNREVAALSSQVSSSEGGLEGNALSEGEKLLITTAPILFSDVLVGEAQVGLDLGVLVDPIVRESTRQLTTVAFAVILFGVLAGVGFVRLLVGPLRRLRSGVEQLTRGDLSIRVLPSSSDEVGELTKAFNQMGESLLQKERLQTAFGRYVDDYVINQLLEQPDGQELLGVEREVTILFVDIRRFTRLSEGMKAGDVVSLLNDIFQRITNCIHSNNGTIDKFIGDSVMAYFGAPIPQPDHAVNAVAAAMEIQHAIELRKAESRDDAHDRVDVDLGIGIHTGHVIVGNIGCERRMDFTAIGDAVNVAHRLEKLAAPGQILISEAVQLKVRGNFKLNFEGERQLSGRVEPVHVYSVDNASIRATLPPSQSEDSPMDGERKESTP